MSYKWSGGIKMGEASKNKGEEFEAYMHGLLQDLGWKTFNNIEIDCRRNDHKSGASNQSETSKRTHGVDVLASFYNPVAKRSEAAIVECKNYAWKGINNGKLNDWIKELINTFECANGQSIIGENLDEAVLTYAILAFNANDNKQEIGKLQRLLREINSPSKRNSFLLLIADPFRLRVWEALRKEIKSIKKTSINKKFDFYYPSINNSGLDIRDSITPYYLFSDFIIGQYTIRHEDRDGTTRNVDIRCIFDFDAVNEESLKYLVSLIRGLQLESRTSSRLEIHVYFPRFNIQGEGRIKYLFDENVRNINADDVKMIFLDVYNDLRF